MKSFVAVLMLAGGLLVAGGVNAANVAAVTYRCRTQSSLTPTTVAGSVGDTFTLQNLSVIFGCSVVNSDTAVVTGNSPNAALSTNIFTLVGPGTATLIL